jgi:hypothetical protein
MTEKTSKTPLYGLLPKERAIMGNLLRMPPEQHKDAAKPTSVKAEGQRRRRQNEREQQGGAKSAL